VAVIAYGAFSVGLLAFAIVKALRHTDYIPKITRTQLKAQSFMEPLAMGIAYTITGLVAINGLSGIALLIWAIVNIVKASG